MTRTVDVEDLDDEHDARPCDWPGGETCRACCKACGAPVVDVGAGEWRHGGVVVEPDRMNSPTRLAS